MYNISYELDNKNIYRFNEPIILNTTFTTNEINFTYNHMNNDFQIYITDLPQYSHIIKRLYNYNETIILEPYKEYNNKPIDSFTVHIVINIENVSYLSKENYVIKVLRNDMTLNNFIIKEIYGTIIYFDWFNTSTLTIDKKDSTVLIDDKIIYVQNFTTTSSNIIFEDTIESYDTVINYLKIQNDTNGKNITINNNDIIVYNITDVYEKTINTTWYMFSGNVFYIG
jgi:hypothetical protein